MKRISVIILFFFLWAHTVFAITLDQETSDYTSTTDGTTTSFSFATAPATGSLVVVTFCGWHNLGYNATAVADNQKNSYTLVEADTVNNTNAADYAYAYNVNSSGTFTVSITNSQSSANTIRARAISFTGVATTTPNDQTGAAAGASSSPVTVTAGGANSQANELVIAVATVDANNISTATTGYTDIVKEMNESTYVGCDSGYKIVSSPETSSATWTANSGGTFDTLIQTFKAATSATTVRHRVNQQ